MTTSRRFAELEERLAAIEEENLVERLESLEDDMEDAKGAFSKMVGVLTDNGLASIKKGKLVAQTKSSGTKRITANTKAAKRAVTRGSGAKVMGGEKDPKVMDIHGLEYFPYIEESGTYPGLWLVVVKGTLTPTDIEALLYAFPVTAEGWKQVNSSDLKVTGRRKAIKVSADREFDGYEDASCFWLAPGDVLTEIKAKSRLYHAFRWSRGAGNPKEFVRFLGTLPEYDDGNLETPELDDTLHSHVDMSNGDIPAEERASAKKQADAKEKKQTEAIVFNPFRL